MAIAFRVDASLQMGTGHLQRCLALADAMRRLGETPVFVTRDLGLDCVARVQNAGHAVLGLPAPDAAHAQPDGGPPHAAWASVTAELDVAQTVEVLLRHAPHWLVVDHYAFDAHWHRAAAAALGTRIAVIDDLADRPISADLVIDANLHTDHRAKYGNHLEKSTPLLAGPRYALLGPAYASARRCTIGERVESIGIFLGGTDPHGLSARMLQICRELVGFKGDLEIATTRANPHHAELMAQADAWPRTRVTLDQPDLAEFFARHDLQIGAGGGATWERCCIGAPTLALVTAENQRTVVEELSRIGAVAAVDPVDDLSAQAIARALAALISDSARRMVMATTTRALVDGRGAERVALRMLAQRLKVRPATPRDCERAYAWRNDPATRNTSLQADPIDWPDHVRWFERTLKDPRRHLLIGDVGTLSVGVVRLDRVNGNTAEVSIYLDPALHGLGLGSRLLHAALAYGAQLTPTIGNWVATILPGNKASEQLFTAAGFAHVQGAWRKGPVDQRIH